MSKYYGTDDGLWSDGQHFRPYRDTPARESRPVRCECGAWLDTAGREQVRCRDCDGLFTVAGDTLTRVPERPWHLPHNPREY